MLIRPPITGDPQLDSWTDQLTRQINQGLVPGSGGGGAGGVGGGGGAPGRPGVAGTDGNTALFLYQRTTAENVIPARPTSVSFDLSNIQQIVTSANEGWSGDIPTMGGDYLWVTFRYISTATTSPITDANSWDTPTLLGVPGEDGEDAVLVIISSHRLPAGVTATQFAANRLGTLRATTTGFQFRDNLGEPKVLRADTYIRGQIMAPEADWTYSWMLNGQSFTPATTPQTLDSQFLVITPDDVNDGGEDVFTCLVTDPS